VDHSVTCMRWILCFLSADVVCHSFFWLCIVGVHTVKRGEGVWESWGITPVILNLSSRWKWILRLSYTEFWWEDLKERGHLEQSGDDGRMILKWIVMELVQQDIDWVRVAKNRSCRVFKPSCYKNCGQVLSIWGDADIRSRGLLRGVTVTVFL